MLADLTARIAVLQKRVEELTISRLAARVKTLTEHVDKLAAAKQKEDELIRTTLNAARVGSGTNS